MKNGPDDRIIEGRGGLPVTRPHFLDLDQRYLYPEPGNRSVLFTCVSGQTRLFFQGAMKRQVFLWDKPNLPDKKDLLSFVHLDGILVDSRADKQSLVNWQDLYADSHEDHIPVSFSDILHQTRWISITEGERYNISLTLIS